MSSPSPQTLRTAYRHLLKAAYAAVQYTVPERFIVRDKLRRAFRFSPASRYNPQRIHNTLEFLDLAATKRGLEHKLVKNLCLVHYHHVSFRKKRQTTEKDKIMEVKAYNSYLETLGLLNESMDLDLR